MEIKTPPQVDIVNIAPSTKFLLTTQATGYQVWEAINDLLDNMDDAGAQHFQVELIKGKNHPKVVLIDDGYGMIKKTLKKCLVLGVSEREIDNYKGKIGDRVAGRYGTGMNTSIATFQAKATIFSRGKGQSEVCKLTYDVSEISKGKSWEIPCVEATAGETLWFNASVNNNTGTIITIENINLFKNEDYINTRSLLIKTISRVFRKHILAGKRFTFKGQQQKSLELKPSDPMLHDVPIIEDNIVYKSKLLQDGVLTDIEYRCRKTGKLKKDGVIRIKTYRLPRADEQFAKKHGINMKSSGIYVMRHDREILMGTTFGIYGKNSTLNRLRIEIYFTTELDEVMRLPYMKNDVIPNQQILDKISEFIQPDVRETRRWWENGQGRVKNKNTKQDHVRKYVRHADDKSTKLGHVPKTLDKKKPTLKGDENSSNDVTMSTVKISYDYHGNAWGKIFEGRVKRNGRQTTEIIVNGNHKLNTDYLNDGKSSDKKYSQDEVLSLCYDWMISLTQAKESNRPPEGDTESVQAYYDMWDIIEQKLAFQMNTLLDGHPK